MMSFPITQNLILFQIISWQTNKFSSFSWLPWPHKVCIQFWTDYDRLWPQLWLLFNQTKTSFTTILASNFCKDWRYELITDNVWSYSHKRLLPILQFFNKSISYLILALTVHNAGGLQLNGISSTCLRILAILDRHVLI